MDPTLDIKIRTSADTSGATAAAQAIGNVDSAAKKAAPATGNLGNQLRGVQQAGAGANQVLNGLAQGGLLGLAQAGRGAITVIRSLATGAIGATLLPILALATGAIIAMNRAINKNTTDIKRMFDDAGKSSKDYADAVAKNEKAASSALQAHTAEVDKLLAKYQELIGLIDAASGRVDATNAAQKQVDLAKVDRDEAKALANATTPEERERIKREAQISRGSIERDYEVSANENKIYESRLKEDAAVATISEQRARIDAAERERIAAQQDFESKLATTQAFKSDDTSPQATEARRIAKAAKDALDRASGNVDTVRAEVGTNVSAAEKQIEAARQQRALGEKNREVINYRTETRAAEVSRSPDDLVKRRDQTVGTIAELESRIKAEEDRAFRSTRLGERANTSGLQAELAKAREQEAETSRLITEDAKLREREKQKLNETLKANKERSGGG